MERDMGWSGWHPIAENKIIYVSVHELPNKQHLFARDVGGAYYHWGDWNSPAMDPSSWTPFGISFVAADWAAPAIAAASWDQGRLDVISIEDHGHGQFPTHRFRFNFPFGEWTEWQNIGGQPTTIAMPAVTAERPGQLNLFTVQYGPVPKKVIHRWYVNDRWSGGDVLDSSNVDSISACSWGPGRQDVFAIGPVQNNVVHMRYENGWSGWESLGGWSDLPPAVATWPGRIDVFITGGDRHIYHKVFADGRWSPDWEPLGGVVHERYQHLAASAGNGGPLRVYHTGTDLKIYENWLM
ncbi:hypothetical protein L3Q65_13840 [Amycolatopsis sp. FU40]|uniref:hypothetical protein n=1 Tax=Amycolatopsis sp. FU40 TaxID=2914159 RepID=UPI001F1F127D|nr:hypothetical protein [Amycolatopsis sp. FU40]UKD57757.1 hypothetical protein L3Q65_13840 [Amycolatopsis sp. FU40]